METIPANPEPGEAARLEALHDLKILDTDPDERFDRIVRIAASHFGVPVARVTFVEADRTWFKACIGLNVREAPRQISICSHAVLQPDPLVVRDLAADPRFANSPQVAGKPHLRFYAGAPISLDGGLRVGAVCVMDYVPHPEFGATEIAFLTDLAAIVVDELHLHRQLAESASIIDARTRDLKKSEERFALAMKGAHDGLWDWNLETGVVYYSPRWASMLGYDPDEIEPTLEGGWGRLVDPMDRDRVLAEVDAYVAGRAEDFQTEFRMRHRDGSWVTVLSRGYLVRDGAKPVRLLGTHVDITLRKQLEAKLAQAQKMEAVGQLTGGVAHDFNNLLAVIQGNAEMITEDGLLTSEAADPILRAARRGAELTQRLLAFSRRQPLRPQVIRPGELVEGMSGLLTRALGETIRVEAAAEPALWEALADPGQVENALLNLAINARDAMPGGGRLVIECANVTLDKEYADRSTELTPGDYVMLAVSDTGTGMSSEVKSHAFEPFFTTKEVGQGSGLGLSMIYGFAKQSGGHVTLYSEEGTGTTVKLYLPRVRAQDKAVADEARDDLPRGRGETVLVIEDDPDVRELTVRMLKNLGYRVVEAADAAAARAVLAGGTPIDLVLSDVVLPGGTSGPQFAREARTSRPELKVIFMSGYPAEAATRNGFLGSGSVLLNKPFRRRQVAEALSKALGRDTDG